MWRFEGRGPRGAAYVFKRDAGAWLVDTHVIPIEDFWGRS
jgi:hypothetical protein